MPTQPIPDTDEQETFDETFVAVLAELKHIVRSIRGGRKSLDLSTIELVDELYIKLKPSLQHRKIDHSHFRNTAAKAVRHLLTDLARREIAAKRGGKLVFVTLKDFAPSSPFPIEKQLDIDRALTRLYAEERQLAQLIDLRFYGGCSDAELAEFFGLSTATVQRRVRSANAWLSLALQGKLDREEM